MSPPVLISSNTEKYTIICGFQRIEAYRLMGRTEITARILPPETPPQACAKFAITDNALQRPLNLIETSRAVCLLSQFFKEPSLLATAASDLGLPVNPSLLRKIGKLCFLPQTIQDGILSDTISLAMALELGELESATSNQQPAISNQQPATHTSHTP
jgi:ParB family chromosome partitioning protein